jgi:putative membrane protein
MKLILRVVINAIAIWVATLLLSGFSFSGSVLNLLAVAIVFGLVNALIRPIVKLLTLPISVVTLGLFSLVINALMLILTVWLNDSLSLGGGLFQNLLTAFVGAILISIVSTLLSWFLPDRATARYAGN